MMASMSAVAVQPSTSLARVAEATSRVTGKVLSDADHRAINEEAIRSL